MPKSGRRPQHQSRRFRDVLVTSAPAPRAAEKRTCREVRVGPTGDMIYSTANMPETRELMSTKSYRGKDGRYHFLYRTEHLDTGNYYIGKHSTHDLDDGYQGS